MRDGDVVGLGTGSTAYFAVVALGERVKAGEPLMDGPRDPHDILAVLGEKELQKYLVNEIQEVYRLQGVNINDKHLEVISRQMMRWVKVEDIGDTEFLPEEVVDRFKFRDENMKVLEAGQRPAMVWCDHLAANPDKWYAIPEGYFNHLHLHSPAMVNVNKAMKK